jgi:predicted nucleic acid-binding protein
MTSVLHTSAVLEPLPAEFDDEVAISIITIAELHSGIMVARDERARGERLRLLSALLAQFDPLPVDDAVASAYGRVTASMASSAGHPGLRTTDLLIAATAVAHGARLVTRHAESLAGLEDVVEIVVL